MERRQTAGAAVKLAIPRAEGYPLGRPAWGSSEVTSANRPEEKARWKRPESEQERQRDETRRLERRTG